MRAQAMGYAGRERTAVNSALPLVDGAKEGWLVTAVTPHTVLVIVTALAFDFTNGFRDTANAARPPPRSPHPKAAGLSAILNLVGAFTSPSRWPSPSPMPSSRSRTRTAPDRRPGRRRRADSPLIVLAGLAGGILWNLFTWLLGLPEFVIARPLGPDRRHRRRPGWAGEVDRRRHQTRRRHRQGAPAQFHLTRDRDAVSSWAAGSCTASRTQAHLLTIAISGGARSAAPPRLPGPRAPTTPRRRWVS